jgi:hypothetical protein
MTLAQVRRLALALPEAAEAPHFDYTSFRVRKKIFATAPPGGAHLHLFVDELTLRQAVDAGHAWLELQHWGKKVYLRAALAKADAKVVAGLLKRAWQDKAPASLLKEAA